MKWAAFCQIHIVCNIPPHLWLLVLLGEDLSSDWPFRVLQGHALSIQILKPEGNAVDQGHMFEIDIKTVCSERKSSPENRSGPET